MTHAPIVIETLADSTAAVSTSTADVLDRYTYCKKLRENVRYIQPLLLQTHVEQGLLSRTQNIGQMIRSHFSHSQFIVVSLKEGMFNNANVVFRTKFVDDVSTVSRTVPKSRAR
ncbi:unnamed protein product [Peronospora belbahrii]|uniref:Uncharacterized protein n=1 Tax=Peronospora belbahrii TaxID=622444 RepID=A0AAU9KX93_9STRA|nr:unnamed protein product [Peronospora belbahrii]